MPMIVAYVGHGNGSPEDLRMRTIASSDHMSSKTEVYCVHHVRGQESLNQNGVVGHHIICVAGKNLGPAKPCTIMLWMSIFWSLLGLQSLRRMNLPDLCLALVSLESPCT